MDGVDLPMFPLGSVLFPGQLLPLHIFEERYQQMLQHCLSSTKEFGVVLIERGHEVGGGDIRSKVGTVAQILQVDQAVEGHWALIAAGVRRIRVDRWCADDPWPHAIVSEFPDPSPAPDTAEPDPMWAALMRQFRRVTALAAEVGQDPYPVGLKVSDDPKLGSFQMAALSPLGSFDRQKLLCAERVMQRMTMLGGMLGEAEDTLRTALALDNGTDTDS